MDIGSAGSLAVPGEGCRGCPELQRSGHFYCAERLFDTSPCSSARGRGDFLGAEDRVHGRRNFIHGSVYVEREANQVHFGQGGISGDQGLPCRIAAEIHSHDFFIAVAEIAHPAEEIAEVNQASQRPGRRQQADIVMTACTLAEVLRKSPMLAENLSGVAVSKAENMLFDNMEGCALHGSATKALAKLFGIENRIHQKTNIVNQSSHVSFFRFRIFDC